MSASTGALAQSQSVLDQSLNAISSDDWISVAISTTEGFSPDGGRATISSGTDQEETLIYSGIDPESSLLTGVTRDEPVAHSAGEPIAPLAEESQSMDADDISDSILDSFFGNQHGCDVTANTPLLDGQFIRYGATYGGCQHAHLGMGVKAILQYRPLAGSEWTWVDSTYNAKTNTSSVSASWRYVCSIGDIGQYRTKGEGEGMHNVNDFSNPPHSDRDKSPATDLSTCLVN